MIWILRICWNLWSIAFQIIPPIPSNHTLKIHRSYKLLQKPSSKPHNPNILETTSMPKTSDPSRSTLNYQQVTKLVKYFDVHYLLLQVSCWMIIAAVIVRMLLELAHTLLLNFCRFYCRRRFWCVLSFAISILGGQQ